MLNDEASDCMCTCPHKEDKWKIIRKYISVLFQVCDNGFVSRLLAGHLNDGEQSRKKKLPLHVAALLQLEVCSIK